MLPASLLSSGRRLMQRRSLFHKENRNKPPRRFQMKRSIRLTIAGAPGECRKRLAEYEGIVEEVICVNVSYSPTQASDPLRSYRNIYQAAVG